MRAERRAARVENSRLRARRSFSTISDLLRSEQNERDRVRMAESRKRKTGDQHQAWFRAQQSRYYNRLASRISLDVLFFYYGYEKAWRHLLYYKSYEIEIPLVTA
ncbi:unnamed protein product [Onchocerca flexuosa]|uniref:Uncharacterized protein n=1 Tax=Onchocerca flexuosa TaxID=387005 RepID=A0A183I323_9BILA|nr:unnamed protein product [Onchocerca flexuosa]